MNADIRIFPAKELAALDMAELMDAALIKDGGILQGCGLSVTPQHELQITSGRIIIKGRLAVVTGGLISRPSGITRTQTCYVCAICDLLAANPFTIEILKSGDYDAVLARADGFSDRAFNVNSGVHVFTMGTVVIDPSVGVTSVTATTDRYAKNHHALDEALKPVNNNIAAANTAISKLRDSGNSSNSVATNKSWINYLVKRSHIVTKFQSELKKYEKNGQVTVSGKGMITVRFRVERGSKNYVVSSGSGGATIDNTIAELWVKEDGTVINQHGATTPGYIQAKDKYGVPTTINNVDWTPFGILAINVSGTNSDNCIINSFGISGNYAYVKIRNTGTAKATLTVALRVLHICAE